MRVSGVCKIFNRTLVMNKIKLLLIEDDFSFSFIVKGSLELTGGYDVYVAATGEEGLKAYECFIPDIIVSDIEMPGMSGLQLVKHIRMDNISIPILFATARISPKDLIDGYNHGADNYIRKPFLPEELDAHIRALLKRTLSTPNNLLNTGYQLGEYLFDPIYRTLQWRTKHFNLTEREMQILEMLYDRKGELLLREEILIKFWGNSDFYTSRSLDVFISSLRKYLENDASIQIQTVRGKGLKLIL